MNKKRIKLKNDNSLKKCYTDILMDNNCGGKKIYKKFNTNKEDNYSSKESITTSFNIVNCETITITCT